MPTTVRALTRDERYPYLSVYTDDGLCRVRVYEAPGAVPVLLITDLEETDNTRVTNLAEYLAAELMVRFLRHRLEEDEPAIVIEHYLAVGRRPLPTFDRMVFSSWTPRPPDLAAGADLADLAALSPIDGDRPPRSRPPTPPTAPHTGPARPWR